MDKNILIVYYLKYLLTFAGFCLLVKILFSKKSAINIERIAKSKREFMKKHRKKTDIIIKLFCTIVLAFGIPMIIIPGLLDIPNAISGNFETATVKVENWSYSSPERVTKRDLQVVNLKTNSRMDINTYYTLVNKGDVFEIKYLPHTKLATITRKVDDNTKK